MSEDLEGKKESNYNQVFLPGWCSVKNNWFLKNDILVKSFM